MSDAHRDDAWGVYRRLLGYARPYWGPFCFGIVGMVAFAATESALAWLVQVFLRGAFVKYDARIAWLIPLSVVVLFLFRGGADFVANYFPGWVGRQVVKTLRQQVFTHYMQLPSAYHDTQSAGQLLSKLTYNIELVAAAATNAAISMIRDTLTIFGLLITLFIMNWRLAAFSLLAAPVIAWLMRIANRLFRRYSARIQNSMGDVTRVAKEAIDAHRLVKIFNAEQHQASRFEKVNESNRFMNMKLVRVQAISNPVVQLIAATGLASVLYVAIRQVFAHDLQVDQFLGFLTALMLVSSPLRRLINVSGPLQQGISAGHSVFELLDTPTEGAGGTRRIVRARGEIEFKDVSFGYVGKANVLNHVSLRVAAGESVALVGRSGSGKTTLVSLLPRFYDVSGGAVLLDGVDIREYRLVDLRNQISLVSQEVVLFNDTIRANIAFNALERSGAEVEAAARAAHVTEFTSTQPNGLDTQLTDRGQNLSGGQRQRISIARALLKDSPVLILDEATASLDNESERHVQQELAILMRGRTTLIIAHRLSTVENADRIIVLDRGRIVEEGAHRDLLTREGAYASLYGMQLLA